MVNRLQLRSPHRPAIVLLAGVLGALATLVGAADAAAQTARVTVRVVGASGPLEGARVRIGSVGLLTDEAGAVGFDLPGGEYVIRATRLGFADTERVLRLGVLRDTTVSLQMEEQAIETEGIVVSSTRSERRIEDEPLRVEVVGREEVEEKLLMTPGDIAMLLNETAGLRVQTTAPSLGGASVRIQGLRGRYTQILSDGLPLYGGQAGALGPLQVPPMDLAQVEVIKGAASALYGSTALGGVVNLISRRPARERELILNQSTLGGTDLVGWVADDLEGAWGYTLLASGHRQTLADVDSDGWANLPRFRRVVARPRLFWDDGAGASAMFTLGGMLEEREGGTLPGRVTPEGGSFREGLDTRRVDGGFVGRWLLSNTLRFSARASASVQGHDHAFGARVERDRHTTGFGEVSLAGDDGAHFWVVGAALQYDDFAARDVPAFDFEYTVPAIFAQDEYSPSEWMTMAASVRLDAHSDYGTTMSPRLSLLLRPDEWAVRLSAGTGYFPPTPLTEETDAVGLGRLVPNTGLVEERARSAMLDVGRVVGPIEFNLSTFASRIDEPLLTRRLDDGTLRLENALEPVRTWGTEALARYHDGPFHVTASHTFLRATEADPDRGVRREVPLTPRHAVGMIGAWEQEDWGRVGIEFYATGRQSLEDNPYRSVSEPHYIIGLLIDRKLGRFRVFLNAENILDTRQTGFDPLLRPSQTSDGRWITDVWAPLEGRSFNGGVWIAF